MKLKYENYRHWLTNYYLEYLKTTSDKGLLVEFIVVAG